MSVSSGCNLSKFPPMPLLMLWFNSTHATHWWTNAALGARLCVPDTTHWSMQLSAPGFVTLTQLTGECTSRSLPPPWSPAQRRCRWWQTLPWRLWWRTWKWRLSCSYSSWGCRKRTRSVNRKRVPRNTTPGKLRPSKRWGLEVSTSENKEMHINFELLWLIFNLYFKILFVDIFI